VSFVERGQGGVLPGKKRLHGKKAGDDWKGKEKCQAKKGGGYESPRGGPWGGQRDCNWVGMNGLMRKGCLKAGGATVLGESSCCKGGEQGGTRQNKKRSTKRLLRQVGNDGGDEGT